MNASWGRSPHTCSPYSVDDCCLFLAWWWWEGSSGVLCGPIQPQSGQAAWVQAGEWGFLNSPVSPRGVGGFSLGPGRFSTPTLGGEVFPFFPPTTVIFICALGCFKVYCPSPSSVRPLFPKGEGRCSCSSPPYLLPAREVFSRFPPASVFLSGEPPFHELLRVHERLFIFILYSFLKLLFVGCLDFSCNRLGVMLFLHP